MTKLGLSGLLCVLILVVITSWLKTISQSPALANKKNNISKPEYYLRNFNLTEFNALGDANLQLSGNYLYYKADTDITEILKPDIEYTTQSHSKWRIRADKIVAQSDDLDQFQLIGHVVAQRLATENLEAADINSDEMLFKPQAEYLETQGETRLDLQNNTIFAAKGLVADMRTGLMTLTRVKGQYQINAN